MMYTFHTNWMTIYNLLYLSEVSFDGTSRSISREVIAYESCYFSGFKSLVLLTLKFVGSTGPELIFVKTFLSMAPRIESPYALSSDIMPCEMYLDSAFISVRSSLVFLFTLSASRLNESDNKMAMLFTTSDGSKKSHIIFNKPSINILMQNTGN